MEDKQYELLNEMIVKINEARTYNRITGFITFIWLFEFFYTFFWTKNFDAMYWLIWVFCVIGWVHMDKKYKFAMEEYEELRKEYDLYYLKKSMDEFRCDEYTKLRDEFKNFVSSNDKPISKEELDKLTTLCEDFLPF